MKYIVTKDEDGVEEFWMFPMVINHNDMMESLRYLKNRFGADNWRRVVRKPIAAGFTDGKKCTGHSETLNLKSRGAKDEALIVT